MDCQQTRISVSNEPGRRTLRLSGTLGVEQAGELWRIARELSTVGEKVAVDWSEVTQVDTSIAQVLLCLKASLQRQKRFLVAAGAPPAARAWLETVGLADLLQEIDGA